MPEPAACAVPQSSSVTTAAPASDRRKHLIEAWGAGRDVDGHMVVAPCRWSKGGGGVKPMGCEVGDGVIAAGIEAGDLGARLDTAARAAALDEDDEVARLSDQPPGDAGDDFLPAMLEAVGRGPAGAGWDRGRD